MIKIKNLYKDYNNKTVLNNINLDLNKNCINFIMGKNGSGKTTLLKCILGLDRYKGFISFGGCTLQSIRNKVFAIYDDIPLYSEMNGIQNVFLMLDVNNKYNITNLLEINLLTEKKLKEKVKDYSLGERKKLVLIAALLSNPEYLIIDEVSNGLDIDTLEIVKNCLITLKHKALVIATGHHFEFYENIIDNLLVIHEGNITEIKNYKERGENLNDIYKKYINSN